MVKFIDNTEYLCNLAANIKFLYDIGEDDYLYDACREFKKTKRELINCLFNIQIPSEIEKKYKAMLETRCEEWLESGQ